MYNYPYQIGWSKIVLSQRSRHPNDEERDQLPVTARRYFNDHKIIGFL